MPLARLAKQRHRPTSISEQGEEVAKLMAKYDLEAVPVVDDEKKLLGRITIDDIVDFIKEEARC
jgi:magnesium transporter